MSAFTHRALGRVNKPVHRLGLALSFGLDPAGFSAALERGLNYVFWGRGPRPLRSLFREALRKDREKYVVATGPTLGFTRGSVRRAAERMLKVLGTDYLDVFQLYWLGKMSRWSDGIAEEEENLGALEKGPLQPDEEKWMRDYGRAVHG